MNRSRLRSFEAAMHEYDAVLSDADGDSSADLRASITDELSAPLGVRPPS